MAPEGQAGAGNPARRNPSDARLRVGKRDRAPELMRGACVAPERQARRQSGAPELLPHPLKSLDLSPRPLYSVPPTLPSSIG